MQRICVFMGASDGRAPEHAQLADDLGRLIGESGMTLVCGGMAVGLMRRVGQAVLDHGGKVISIVPRAIAKVEGGVDDLRHERHRIIVVRSMEHRKAGMMSLAEGFVFIPGGAGTFAELWPVLDTSKLQRQGMHVGQHKPAVFLAADDFFEGTLQQIETGIRHGFMPEDFRDLYRLARSPEEALMRLLGFHEKYRGPKGRRVAVRSVSHGAPVSPDAPPVDGPDAAEMGMEGAA